MGFLTIEKWQFASEAKTRHKVEDKAECTWLVDIRFTHPSGRTKVRSGYACEHFDETFNAVLASAGTVIRLRQSDCLPTR